MKLYIEDLLKMKGTDFSDPGLRDGTVKYQSVWIEAAKTAYLESQNKVIVKETFPMFAEAMLSFALAMNAAWINDKKATDEDILCFEKHMRKHTLIMAMLFNFQLAWYHRISYNLFVKQFKATRWLKGHSQTVVEASMQSVALSVSSRPPFPCFLDCRQPLRTPPPHPSRSRFA